MNNMRFNPITDREFLSLTTNMNKEASVLKKELFKASVIGNMELPNKLDLNSVVKFRHYVHDFLEYWENYSNSLKDYIRIMKDLKLRKGHYNIEYNYVKGYIYSTFDYASLIQFTDGVLRGIKDNTIDKVDKVEDFKDHTISMAFDGMSRTTTGLINDTNTSEMGLDRDEITTSSIKMFENIRLYENLFKDSDRKEIYDSINTVISYILGKKFIMDSKDYDTVRLYTALINNLVEYMVYMLTLYASRIFIISKYCRGFIHMWGYDNSKTADEISESVDRHQYFVKEQHPKILDIGEVINGTISETFRILDELIIKDPNKNDEFFSIFRKFIKDAGAYTSDINDMIEYTKGIPSRKLICDSELCQQLESNPLYSLTSLHCNDFSVKSNGIELHENLKNYLFNNRHGLGNETSYKQEMLHHIKCYNKGETLKGYKTVTTDLYILGKLVSCRILEYVDRLKNAFESELNLHKNGLSHRKLLAECSNYLLSFYEEFMFAISQKMKYVEAKINQCRDREISKAIAGTQLNIPDLKSDLSLTHTMGLSIPGTLRMPMELMDIYELPIFEEYEMYDDYLKSLPEFVNDPYFTEASAGELMNSVVSKILTAIKAATKIVIDFIQGQQFKAASKWITDNERALLNMDLSNVEIEGKPYNENINIGFKVESLISELNSIDIVEASKDVTKYITDLYKKVSGDKIADIFINNGAADSKVLYKNLILFGVDSKDEVGVRVIRGDELKKLMTSPNTGWIDNIKNGDKSIADFKNIDTKLSSAINSLKSKLVSTSNVTATDTTEGSTEGIAENNTGDLSDLLIKIQSLINNLWSPIVLFERQVLIDQYNYIKLAYSAGRSTTQEKSQSGQETNSNTSI